MKRPVFRLAFALLAIAASAAPRAAQQDGRTSDAVVLVTLDGARTEEIFGGLDRDVLESTLKEGDKIDDALAYRRFAGVSSDDQRRKLMPFFWTLVTSEGSIAGNRTLGSAVRLSNRHWFSYPGYAEILLGEAHDDDIKSNDAIRNPYSTVLEGLSARLNLPADKVATFASWSVFNEIVEHTPGATFINAGVQPLQVPAPEAVTLNELQREVVTPWDATRFDAFTFRLAMTYLASVRPRVLYIAFDETDDWAHDGRYDRVLEAYARIDGYLKELWTWLQSQPDYQRHTHLLVTTDHGRGHTPKDWRDHKNTVNGSQDVWIAFVSPKMARRGEWHDAETLSSNRIAATLADWMGVDWSRERPAAGAPVR